ncbi:MAG: hypothetical protein JW982_10460 [Spirochaetes bacterium]|nr:hypothetical protein [Spirochaetota bacterium]
MKLTVDLHSHSPYAGGSGKTDFSRLRTVMIKKGISVYGSGDILLRKWEQEVDAAFQFDTKRQMWTIPGGLFLMPQAEIIITLPYLHDNSRRKLFHLVILFSTREDIITARTIMEKNSSKLTVGRPFATFDSSEAFQDFIMELSQQTKCALIPAHIMTPEGILGGKNPVNSIYEIFGDSAAHLTAVESGLSADPEMLSVISSDSNLPVVSFSDAHSASYNKLGREFTTLNCTEISSESVINSIRKKDIFLTAEFPPFEGRYYLTGHRGDRPGHDGIEFAVPADQDEFPSECPVCSRKLTPGVKERLSVLNKGQKSPSQNFVYQIPLIEIISQLRKTGVQSKKAEKEYLEILSHVGNESEIWTEDTDSFLSGKINQDILDAVGKIKSKNFSIKYGFDGQYGAIIL